MAKTKWQLKHEENGYEVECLQAGQVRRYGPTINRYVVRDLTSERTEEEIREYCTTKVKRADDPRKHSLTNHLQRFARQDDGSYSYICGHEWTG